MGTPRDGMNVWSLAFQPHNTQVIYAGYEPFGIYRSEDGGQSWRETDTSHVAFPGRHNLHATTGKESDRYRL